MLNSTSRKFWSRSTGVKEFSVLSFWKLNSLKRLFLSSNEIEYLPDVGFSGANNLTELWLDLNRIKFIHEQAFQSLQDLKLLSLQGNRIEQLPDGIFNQLPNLEILYIGENQIKISSIQYTKDQIGSEIKEYEDNIDVENDDKLSDKEMHVAGVKCYNTLERNLDSDGNQLSECYE
ncbi:SLIT and NTRK-like protein 4 [Condylostylus longicornis]|uniref:SLIT and NTRK-like protein 4 n=1 Tax=Condylostylus longicornis TaxID=2530218 RepID=UPI00244DD673|nr:SLIT and NTRK-like protein 4 [Condylostylus longicornis]